MEEHPEQIVNGEGTEGIKIHGRDQSQRRLSLFLVPLTASSETRERVLSPYLIWLPPAISFFSCEGICHFLLSLTTNGTQEIGTETTKDHRDHERERLESCLCQWKEGMNKTLQIDENQDIER